MTYTIELDEHECDLVHCALIQLANNCDGCRRGVVNGTEQFALRWTADQLRAAAVKFPTKQQQAEAK